MENSKDHKAAAEPTLDCRVGRWRVRVLCGHDSWLSDVTGNTWRTLKAENAKTWPSHAEAKRAAWKEDGKYSYRVEAAPNASNEGPAL